MNKNSTKASIEYINSKEYKVPKSIDIVKCSNCGKEMKRIEAALRYETDPISFALLPPELRKYYCNNCM